MLELVGGGLLSTGIPRLVLTDRHFHNNEIFGAELERACGVGVGRVLSKCMPIIAGGSTVLLTVLGIPRTMPDKYVLERTRRSV